MRQRGVVIFLFVITTIGAVALSDVVYGYLDRQDEWRKQSIRQNQNTVLAARTALLSYMLLRSENPLNIARKIGPPIEPRLLMLLCPDNAGGDNILDGQQNPTCGVTGSGGDIVNGILASGSRFGRLPYKTSFNGKENEINDGLGGDFRDIYGNRLWYAVSQNLAPAINNAPLNFHRLATLSDNWLAVGALQFDGATALLTINAKVAAVVLAPGKNKSGRLPELHLSTSTVQLSQINPDAYFESANGHSNADKDGVFVRWPDGDDNLDDPIAYIGMNDLLYPGGTFMQNYMKFTGIRDVHNAPAASSPLDRVQQALVEWHDFFAFYPLPAPNAAASINSRFRHCAAFETTTTAKDVELPANAAVILPAAAAVRITGTTALLQNRTAVLAAQPLTASLSSPVLVIFAGEHASLYRVTLATYARFTLTANTQIHITPDIATPADNMLSAGVTVTVANIAAVTLTAKTPLLPGGIQSGWLPGHYPEVTLAAARDGTRFAFHAPLPGGFLGGANISLAVFTASVSSTDRFVLHPPGFLKIEEDFSQLVMASDAVWQQHTLAANSYLPTRRDFERRQFVVLLLSDLTRSQSVTLHAPKVLYPWRQKTGPDAPAASRDNLHDYPPCFDLRLLKRKTRTFIRNQNMHYAVSPGCYADSGGDASQCGQNGITLTLAEGAKIAAPESFTLTNSFTTTVQSFGREHALVFTDGSPDVNLTLTTGAMLQTGGPSPAYIRLPRNFIFTAGQPVILAAGITVSGNVRIENIPALILYSPAPLGNVQCAANMPTAISGRAWQGRDNADLTNLCEWTDDDENADGDMLYVAHPQKPEGLPASNDFFLLFGGQTVLPQE